jgi:hypothetical protein
MDKKVELRGKQTNRELRKRNRILRKKLQWLNRQVGRQRKKLNSYQDVLRQLALLSPEAAARCLGKVEGIITRGPHDPSGRSDEFTFPAYPSLKDRRPPEVLQEEAA